MLQLINATKGFQSQSSNSIDTETVLSQAVVEELQKSFFDYPLKQFFPELLVNARKIVDMVSICFILFFIKHNK